MEYNKNPMEGQNNFEYPSSLYIKEDIYNELRFFDFEFLRGFLLVNKTLSFIPRVALFVAYEDL